MRDPTARYQRTVEMQQSVRVMRLTPAYHLQEARHRRSTTLRVPSARPRRTAPRNERVGPYSLHETSTRKMIVHGKGQCNQARNGTSQKLKRSSARASVVAPTTICGEKKIFSRIVLVLITSCYISTLVLITEQPYGVLKMRD